MKGHPQGRKSKLTKELADQVLQLIEVGNYIETACAAVGLTDRSYYAWIQRGIKAMDEALAAGVDEEFLAGFGWDDEWPQDIIEMREHEVDCIRFVQAANKAAARSEAYAVTIVRTAMPQQWTAAMTFLERRFPQRWKRRDLREVATIGESGENERMLIENPDANAAMHEALELIAGEGVEITDA